MLRGARGRLTAVLTHFQSQADSQPENDDHNRTELQYDSPFGLLVAVVLSAQCTDVRVNQTAPRLMAQYPTPKAMAQAAQQDVFELIKNISYPNNKAKHLVATAQRLATQYDSKLPTTVEKLMELPGVGRKTAHVIAAELYNTPVLAVDTHVFRVSHRLGLVPRTATTPLGVEKAIMQVLQKLPNYHGDLVRCLHHWLILHGRYTCVARKPKCNQCPFEDFCPSSSAHETA